MLDHIGISVSDLDASIAFYEGALAPLGVRKLMEREGQAGFGEEINGVPFPYFWTNFRTPITVAHIAFSSPDHETIDRFHEAAIAAGGTDNGPPGPRPEYHPRYYGAFVLDPDGNNIEAACHLPQ